MGKQWVRQEIKRDELAEQIDRLVVWISKNQQLAGMIAAGAAVVIVGSALLIYRSRSIASASWDRLALAEEAAYAGQGDSAISQLKSLSEQYSGSDAAAYGLLFQGDLFYTKGSYKEALESYGKVAEYGRPKVIQPLAVGDSALAQEAAGDCAQAIQTAQRFLETYPDHYLAPQVHACLARCLEASGQADQARTAAQKIVLQYPDTSFAAWARQKVEGVKPGAPAAAPPAGRPPLRPAAAPAKR